MTEPLDPSLKLYVITSESMRPELEIGDFLMVEEAAAGRFELGDLAVRPPSEENKVKFVHRVVAIRGTGSERRLTTKGDVHVLPDEEIPEAQAEGRAVFHGRRGRPWTRLDLAPARWGARAAAAAFSRTEALKDAAAWRRLEDALLAVCGLAWADPALAALCGATRTRRWRRARGLRRALLSVALGGEQRLWNGPVLAQVWIRRLGAYAAAWGLGAARLQAAWGFGEGRAR